MNINDVTSSSSSSSTPSLVHPLTSKGYEQRSLLWGPAVPKVPLKIIFCSANLQYISTQASISNVLRFWAHPETTLVSFSRWLEELLLMRKIRESFEEVGDNCRLEFNPDFLNFLCDLLPGERNSI